MSPYRSMNWSKSAWVCSPRASAASISFRSAEHVLDPLHRLRVGVLHDLPHAAELAVQHLAAQQVLELLEGLRGRPVSASRSRPAAGSPGPCRRAARRGRPRASWPRRSGRGTARRAPARWPCRAGREPARGCRRAGRCRGSRAAVRGPGAACRRGRAVRPGRRSPRRSSSRSASAGLAPASIASPSSSTAPRTSNGSASGSGP